MSSSLWPLLDRFPRLADVPRVALRAAPTPVQSLEAIKPNLWIKRDDLTALPIGGNKARSLEFLLGGVRPGERVATVGPHGSTHALATVVYAEQVGAEVSVGLWRQEMNPVAELVASELRRVASRRKELHNPALAIPWLWWRHARGDRTIPPGGTSALGILGHVNAGLELAAQIAAGEMPEPKIIVVPLGSGGTVAGIALGLRIAGLRPAIIAARVVPHFLGRRQRVERLAGAAARLIRHRTGENIPGMMFTGMLPGSGFVGIRVASGVYGGAYGRALDRATAASQRLSDAIGVRLDSTYAGKAFVAALEMWHGTTTLFWLTFDGRWLGKGTVG